MERERDFQVWPEQTIPKALPGYTGKSYQREAKLKKEEKGKKRRKEKSTRWRTS